MLTRAMLTVFLWALTLAVGLLTANLQHANFVRAAELDELKRECDVIQAAIDERSAIAESRQSALLDGRVPAPLQATDDEPPALELDELEPAARPVAEPAGVEQ